MLLMVVVVMMVVGCCGGCSFRCILSGCPCVRVRLTFARSHHYCRAFEVLEFVLTTATATNTSHERNTNHNNKHHRHHHHRQRQQQQQQQQQRQQQQHNRRLRWARWTRRCTTPASASTCGRRSRAPTSSRPSWSRWPTAAQRSRSARRRVVVVVVAAVAVWPPLCFVVGGGGGRGVFGSVHSPSPAPPRPASFSLALYPSLHL